MSLYHLGLCKTAVNLCLGVSGKWGKNPELESSKRKRRDWESERVINYGRGLVYKCKIYLGVAHNWLITLMNSYKENAQLRTSSTIWVDHVQSLGIFGPNHSLESGPHVCQFPVCGVLVGLARKHACPHWNSSQKLHDMKLLVWHLLPPNRVSNLSAIAVHSPNELLH